MYREQTAPPYTGNVARDLVHRSSFPLLVFLLAHIPLALTMRQFAAAATLHALATLGIGILWAISTRRLERTAFVIAYITGAEILWRMTGAQVFWEFGKYATVLIAVLAMARARRLGGPLLPLAYFALLLPSTLLTLSQMTAADAREQISFNLSGPLALFTCAWFFSHLRLARADLLRLLLVLVGPAIGIATVALYGTLTAEAIQFTDESNFLTSGGFGPNQVSAMLGLGALFCFLYVLNDRSRGGLRLTLLVAMLVLATQSALTFSRGGLYTAGGAAAVAVLYLLRDNRARLRMVLVVALIALAANYLIIPALDEFTGGALSQRFQDTSLTGRDRLLEADLQIWQEHPIFGAGPGGGGSIRARAALGQLGFDRVAAHTELSRLLAEHGTLGLLALLLLAGASVRNLRRQRNSAGKALVAALIVWALLFMLGSAMRLVAPAALFGLSFAIFDLAEDQ